MLWAAAAVALLAHTVPFWWFGEPEQLGEGTLTEAIAVELIDKAALDAMDQTRASPPSAGAPPAPQTPPAPKAPPGPPQKAQKAIPPAPPPSPPAAQPAAPAPSLPDAPPVFEGDGQEAKRQGKKDKEPPAKEQPETKKEPEKQRLDAKRPEPPRPPSPPRPPPQQQVAPRAAPPPPPPQAKPAPPRQQSRPAEARSGEITQFAKEVVAALAMAKPNGPPGVEGKVTVTVVVAFGGGVRTARVTGSSGREDLDKLALEAAKKAKLPAPPPDVTTDDLFYDVEYNFKE